MDLALGALIFVVGAGLAAFVVWTITNKKLALREAALQESQTQLGDANIRLAAAAERATRMEELETQLAEAGRYREEWRISEGKISALQQKIQSDEESHQKQIETLRQAEENLKKSFEAMAAEAVAKSQKSFLEMASENFKSIKEESKTDLEARRAAIEGLVKPIHEQLQDLGKKTENLEKDRVSSFQNLKHTLDELRDDQRLLRSETGKLSNVLRNPKQRGSWGEIQLKRIVEFAGLVERCDFVTEESHPTESGRIRPDVIVRLPNNRNIIIDAKSPMDAYTQSIEALHDGEREERMKAFAATVKNHLLSLRKKNYDKAVADSADLIVMFLPLESMFSAAVEQDPTLLDFGAESGVLIATPVTLIALLRAVAIGWRQEDLTKSAREVAKLGSNLYDGIHTFMDHYAKLGRNLETAVNAFNLSVGTLEKSVVRRASKLKTLYNKQKALEEPKDIDQVVRPLAVVQTSEDVLDIEEEVEPDALPAPTLDLD